MNSFKKASFHASLRYMDDVVLRLKDALPEVRVQEVGADEPRYRFPLSECAEEVRLKGCVMLKIVQMASNLNASDLLLSHGYVCEFMMLVRCVMEASGDVSILLSDDTEEHHSEMLDIFYSEDIGFTNAGEDHPVVRREFPKKSRRELLGLVFGEDFDHKQYKGNYDIFSGHVHGRAAAIMHLYIPGRFLTYGLHRVGDYSLAPSYRKNFWIAVYWAMIATIEACEKWYGESPEGRSILREVIKISPINPPEDMDI